MRLVFLAFLLASSPALAADTITTSSFPKSSSGGRFQVIQLSDMRRDQFLIDTQTGKMWHRICLVASPGGGDCELFGWLAEDVDGITKSKKEIYTGAQALEQYMKTQQSASTSDK